MSFDLFRLLPAVYRMRDAQLALSMQLLTPEEQAELYALQVSVALLTVDEQARLDELSAKATCGPLQSLLMVIDEQLAIMAADLDQLYDDQFIETCAPWVIPYIGDLIGYQAIHGIAPSVDNPRSEVANTISLRRRKGTALVLEQLAHEITGWGAHAVEFFEVLADTQYMKHVRRHNVYATDVRGWASRLNRNSGFSKMTHRVDVRNLAAVGLPRYNVQNLGIYLWSLGAYSLTGSAPVSVAGAPGCYRFHPLGMDAPLFHRSTSQGSEFETPATEKNVPDWLHRLVLCADLQKGAGSAYYGVGSSLTLSLDGQLLNPYQVQVADLSGADGSWANRPMAGSAYAALVDPELGRIALPPVLAGGTPAALTASYLYGFNADMGGGEYERQDGFVVTDPAAIFPYPDTALPSRYGSLQEALTYVVGQMGAESKLALEIADSTIYTVTTTGPVTIDMPEGTTLEVRAAGGARPTLLLDGEFAVSGAKSSTVILNGLLIGAGAGMAPGVGASALVHVPQVRPGGEKNELSELDIYHCTLVPGWAVTSSGEPLQTQPVLIAEPPGLGVVAKRSILGGIRAASNVTILLHSSIIDATDRTRAAYTGLNESDGGGSLTLKGCTVVGKVHAQELTLVSNSLLLAALAAGDTWASALIADRRQTGCVRFSFLPVNAITPRRFECVEQALAAPAPILFALRYGHPGYMKMLACTADVIRRGADDGGEMGAFHFVLAPLRESDLLLRLQEYLPVGLDVGLIYQT